MIRVFLSLADEDIPIGNRLKGLLKQYGLEIWDYKSDIKLATTSLQEIDKALNECNFVLGIVTENYMVSVIGQKEAYAALLDERFIPLFFLDSEKRKARPLWAATQGVVFHGKQFENAVEELVTKIKLPRAADHYAKIQGPSVVNPFRRVKAEYFDHDYIGLATNYRKPPVENIELAKGRRPVFIMGGRGSGKTMVLKSLEVRTAASIPLREEERVVLKGYSQAGLDYYGIYIKCERGCFSSSTEEELSKLGESVVRRLFVNDFNLKILYALVESLRDSSDAAQTTPIVQINREMEQKICETIGRGIRPQERQFPTAFNDMLLWLDGEASRVVEYVDRRAYDEKMRYAGCHTKDNTLDRICGRILTLVPQLSNSKFYLLLDEYENLMEYQQIILNGMLKSFQNVVFKIGVKFEGMRSHRTPVGQQLQHHDYDVITLDFKLDKDDLRQYTELLKKVTRVLLREAGYPNVEITEILENPPQFEISAQEMKKEVEELLQSLKMNREDFIGKYLDPPEVRFGIPLTFRALHRKRAHRKKKYAGFETFVYLSSGIIRYFLELCAMAFYVADLDNPSFRKAPRITVDQQTRAAYLISDHYLDLMADGLEEYGDAMQRLVLDLGDIMRERLLHHQSEPEALRIEIQDPGLLQEQQSRKLTDILQTATRESVLHQRSVAGGYVQWSKLSTRSREYILNRIYAPALQIGYTARHRLNVTTGELLALLNPKTHDAMKRRLQAKQRRVRTSKKGATETRQDQSLKNFPA